MTRLLSELAPGTVGRLHRLGPVGPVRLRLLRIGFVRGRQVHVVSRGMRGALVVALGDARVALDADLAHQITVMVPDGV